MNNHVIGLEDSFGTFKWELNKKVSEALREYPEDSVRKYLSAYQSIISHTLHLMSGMMSLPPVLQQKYAETYIKVIQILATNGLEELKELKEKE